MFDSKVIGRHVAFMRVMAQRGSVGHVVLAAIHAAVSELGRRDRRRGVMALRDMAARLRGASGR
jgi:hypothetical protein